MNKITVWPRNYFYSELKKMGITDENVVDFKNSAFISIQTSKVLAPMETPYFKKQHPNALTITFDDITDKEIDYIQLGAQLFTEKDAKTIYKFVRDNISKHFIIHCTAGISRSGAVGEFIQRVTETPYYEFIRENPNIRPNYFVLGKLIRTWTIDNPSKF